MQDRDKRGKNNTKYAMDTKKVYNHHRVRGDRSVRSVNCKSHSMNPVIFRDRSNLQYILGESPSRKNIFESKKNNYIQFRLATEIGPMEFEIMRK
jgi:hypothetical protein